MLRPALERPRVAALLWLTVACIAADPENAETESDATSAQSATETASRSCPESALIACIDLDECWTTVDGIELVERDGELCETTPVPVCFPGTRCMLRPATYRHVPSGKCLSFRSDCTDLETQSLWTNDALCPSSPGDEIPPCGD